MDLAALRLSYMKGGLTEGEVHPDPCIQFARWFEQALTARIAEPNAMALATADASGAPCVRMVLLKSFDDAGFVWYTNYGSRKGREIEENPRASLLFYWPELERQVRVSGNVGRVSSEESDAYFATRPFGHQLGAWSSQQSSEIHGRDELEERLKEVTARFGLGPVVRPPYWGGFRLRPSALEFWQGRPNRMHDRLEYRRSLEGGWTIHRLAP